MYFDAWSASVSRELLGSRCSRNSSSSSSFFSIFFSCALYSSTTAFGASGYSWYAVLRNTPASE